MTRKRRLLITGLIVALLLGLYYFGPDLGKKDDWRYSSPLLGDIPGLFIILAAFLVLALIVWLGISVYLIVRGRPTASRTAL